MRLALLIACLGAPTAALAEIEAPRGETGPPDAVWIQATLTKPFENGSLSAQAGRLGGQRIRYISVQGERKLGGGFGAGATYALGESARNGTVQLARIFANWTNGGERLEIDGRLWLEAQFLGGGRTTEQARARVRASVLVPGVADAIKPRLFVAEEIFVEAGEGFTRNRVFAGIRTQPIEPLSLDLAWQRSDDSDGVDQNVFLVQLSWSLGR